jgi:hypothetical protein
MDNDKPKRGPKPKLTPELTRGIIEYIKKGNHRSVAAKRFGLGISTLRAWLKTGREHTVLDFQNSLYRQLLAGILEAEVEVETRAVNSILLAGQVEDPRLLCWYLERKYPERWGKYVGELRELQRELAELRKMIAEREAEHV